MPVRFGGEWIAESEKVVLLHAPGRYPVAYFPRADIAANALQPSDHTSQHRDVVWRAMDAFYEADERILGRAADQSGHVRPPERAGSGLDLDWEAVTNYAVRASRYPADAS
jgi:L-alanine-DL-glutamate epimerase-like enolase superfamily enzyme